MTIIVYDNGQLATALWYHDHALGITRLNVICRAGRVYISSGTPRIPGDLPRPNPAKPRPGENTLGLPGPAAGHGVRSFLRDSPGNPGSGLQCRRLPRLSHQRRQSGHPSQWVQDFFGDVICVNGKAWPYLQVEPRRYRFRLLNACNSRLLDLSLDSHQPIFQIGSDGGFLPAVAQLNHLRIAPAERADLILDFTGLAGATITLRNHARTPFVEGEPPNPANHRPDHAIPGGQTPPWRGP